VIAVVVAIYGVVGPAIAAAGVAGLTRPLPARRRRAARSVSAARPWNRSSSSSSGLRASASLSMWP